MELTSALLKLKKGAPGLDQIHPLILKNIADSAKRRLLDLFNRSWLKSRVPSDWRKAVIIPIIKKNKPANKIKSYRPVALLSVVSKVLETMIASRIKTWAESTGMIPEKQSGLQPRRSTLDTLASISQRALDNLQKPTPERTLLVAVDFTAAFDRVWKVGLLRDLASWNLPNRCLAWLSDRRGTVKWNDTIGRFKVFREGVRKAARSPPFCFALLQPPSREPSKPTLLRSLQTSSPTTSPWPLDGEPRTKQPHLFSPS